MTATNVIPAWIIGIIWSILDREYALTRVIHFEFAVELVHGVKKLLNIEKVLHDRCSRTLMEAEGNRIALGQSWHARANPDASIQ